MTFCHKNSLESDPDWRGPLVRRRLVPLVVAAVVRAGGVAGGGVVAEHAANHAGVRGGEVVVADRAPDALVPVGWAR